MSVVYSRNLLVRSVSSWRVWARTVLRVWRRSWIVVGGMEGVGGGFDVR